MGNKLVHLSELITVFFYRKLRVQTIVPTGGSDKEIVGFYLGSSAPVFVRPTCRPQMYRVRARDGMERLGEFSVPCP